MRKSEADRKSNALAAILECVAIGDTIHYLELHEEDTYRHVMLFAITDDRDPHGAIWPRITQLTKLTAEALGYRYDERSQTLRAPFDDSVHVWERGGQVIRRLARELFRADDGGLLPDVACPLEHRPV